MNIPLIETCGTHFEVGHQIGIAARASLEQLYNKSREYYGGQWGLLLAQSHPFRKATEEALPNVLEEMRGCAEGAGIAFEDLFLMSVEELLYEEVRGQCSPATQNRGEGKAKGCSDLAAAPPATVDGHVWLAHNNDLGRSTQEHLFVTHFRVKGEPEILAVTVGGLYISIGINDAGISLTGNQLTANDSRVGVPRLLMVRDILARTSFESALKAALLPERASSYNNIVAARTGEIVDVEGSATSYELLDAEQQGGTVVHTNHYIAPAMLKFEADDAGKLPSASRCARAFEYANKYRGKIGFEVCARFVRDHVYAPWSVCKHAGLSVTVFGAIIDLSELKMWLARGNPCEEEFELYEFSRESAHSMEERAFV